MQVQLETVTLTHEEYASVCRNYEELLKARVNIENKYIMFMDDYIVSLKEHKATLEKCNEITNKYVKLQDKHEKLQLQHTNLLRLLLEYMGMCNV